MDHATAITELERHGSEQTRKTYRRHGVLGDQYGVSYAHLKSMKKAIKTDQALAESLWASGNHDARPGDDDRRSEGDHPQGAGVVGSRPGQLRADRRPRRARGRVAPCAGSAGELGGVWQGMARQRRLVSAGPPGDGYEVGSLGPGVLGLLGVDPGDDPRPQEPGAVLDERRRSSPSACGIPPSGRRPWRSRRRSARSRSITARRAARRPMRPPTSSRPPGGACDGRVIKELLQASHSFSTFRSCCRWAVICRVSPRSYSWCWQIGPR